MDLYRFNYQDIQGRAALIWRYGTFIEFREEEAYRIILYDMGNFYAELWYDADLNHLKHARGFKSWACLEAYLELVDLSDILS